MSSFYEEQNGLQISLQMRASSHCVRHVYVSVNLHSAYVSVNLHSAYVSVNLHSAYVSVNLHSAYVSVNLRSTSSQPASSTKQVRIARRDAT